MKNTNESDMETRNEAILDMCELLRDTGSAIAAEPGYDDIRERISKILPRVQKLFGTRSNSQDFVTCSNDRLSRATRLQS